MLQIDHVIVGAVPDDERTRRRMGDETKERIADLASGWSVDSSSAPPTPEVAEPPQRKKPKTLPPPPPGSNERAALERAIVESEGTPEPERVQPAPAEVSRSRPISVPPPIPATRSKPVSAPPPIPVPARAKSPSAPPAPAIVREPHIVIDSVLPSQSDGAPPTNPHLAVPINEFGHQAAPDPNRAGLQPLTIKRDAAEALLQIEAAPPREDPTAIDTSLSSGDVSMIERPSGNRLRRGGTLRPTAALRRQRGVLGDIRYVFTASLGIRRMRAELGELEARQDVRQASRRRHLVALGRTAVTLDSISHPALGDARERLGQVEDERSLHAGAVAAADGELERVRRDREAKVKKYAADCAAIDSEARRSRKEARAAREGCRQCAQARGRAARRASSARQEVVADRGAAQLGQRREDGSRWDPGRSRHAQSRPRCRPA